MAHTFPVTVDWSGTTAGGYRDYGRTHAATTDSTPGLLVSADPHFRGEGEYHNPEQLLVIAASSCQMLSFLALAARRGLDVRGYHDDAVGTMTPQRGPMRVELIELRPHITLRAGEDGVDEDAVLALVAQAHRECFIANSLTTQILITATVTAG